MNLTNEEIEKRISDSYELPNRVVEKYPHPLVSIRTSTYNHGPYIKQCIEGVLMQKTNFPFEYIIGEDYSTDETRKIVFEYAKKYPDIIRVITADYNVGSKANGRRCTMACRGKYIAICEGDDYWTDPLKLQKQVEILEKYNNVIVCFHQFQILYEDSKTFSIIKPETQQDLRFFNLNDYITRKEWLTQTLTCMYRNDERINKYRSKYKYSKDLSFFYTLLSLGDGVLLKENMAIYRKHKGGIWSGINFNNQIIDDYKCIKNIYDIEQNQISAQFIIGHYISRIPIKLFIKKIKVFYPIINIAIKHFGLLFFIKVSTKKILHRIKKL